MNANANSSQGPKPCAVCKHLARICGGLCDLAPYFPAEKEGDFQSALAIFGLNNIMQRMNSVAQSQKAATAEAILFEGRCWAEDPVNGCLGRVRVLEEQAEIWKAAYEMLQLNPTNSTQQPLQNEVTSFLLWIN